jgi:hypothetical protein
MDPADVNNESAESGEPIRYELVPVTPRMVETLGWPPKVKAKVDLGDPGLPTAPPLVLDVGIRDAIRVIDANTKALIASARLAQMTATPGIYERINDGAEITTVDYRQPLLVLEIPGMQLRIGIPPIRVATLSGAQFRYRYTSRGRERAGKWPMPTHLVTDTEWFSLLEKFGLAALVVDEYASGKLDRRDRFAKLYLSVFLGLLFVASTAFFVWYLWGIIAHGRPVEEPWLR